MNNIPVFVPQREEQSLILSTEPISIEFTRTLLMDDTLKASARPLLERILGQSGRSFRQLSLETLLSGEALYNDVVLFQTMMSQQIRPVMAEVIHSYIHELIAGAVQWPKISPVPTPEAVVHRWLDSWGIEMEARDKLTNLFLKIVGDAIEVPLDTMFARDPWRMWNCQRMGNDFLIERNADYRVVDWELKRTEESEVSLYDLVTETDHEQIQALNNEIINAESVKRKEANARVAKQMLRYLSP